MHWTPADLRDPAVLAEAARHLKTAMPLFDEGILPVDAFLACIANEHILTYTLGGRNQTSSGGWSHGGQEMAVAEVSCAWLRGVPDGHPERVQPVIIGWRTNPKEWEYKRRIVLDFRSIMVAIDTGRPFPDELRAFLAHPVEEAAYAALAGERTYEPIIVRTEE